jgi:ribokinase
MTPHPDADAGPWTTTPHVLVAGSVNLDVNLTVDDEPDDDGTGRVLSLTTTSGGHAGNCAAAMVRLGCAADVFAAVGGDPEGTSLLAELQDSGVGTTYVQRLADVPSGRVVIPNFSGRRYMLMFRGATDEMPGDSCDRLPLSRFDAVVVFDPEPGLSLHLLRRARDRGVRSYWSPGGLGTRETWVAENARLAGTLVLNRTEFAAVTGAAAGPQPVTTACRQLGPARLVVTCGADGALASDGLRCWFAPAVPAPVRDPTGAGDAFTAAMVAADLLGRPWPEPLAWGAAAGSQAVSEAGARARGLSLDRLIELVSTTAVSVRAVGPEGVVRATP